MVKEKKLQASLPAGFEDRWNKKLVLKKKLISIIEENFLKYGFSPLETPSFEVSENIGSFLADDESNPMSEVFTFDDDNKKITLRYDLSSPLARFVAQNYLTLPFPYKRYQIGNVWRNEKAGNARYREFTQADCDIVGNFNQGQANAELIKLIIDTLLKCGFKEGQFKINIGNRKIIAGLLNQLGIKDKSQELKTIRAIDKLEKFGIEGLKALLKKGRKDSSGAFTEGANLSEEQVKKILNFINLTRKFMMEQKSKDFAKDLISSMKAAQDKNKMLMNPISIKGMEEINEMYKYLEGYTKFLLPNDTMVRGLEYYDGIIIETKLKFKIKNLKGKDIDIGSICSGGQYGKLVSRFKGVDFPGTGVSFGVDRLLFAMMQLDEMTAKEKKPVLVCVMDEKYLTKYYEILQTLRDNNINSEIYLDPSKNLGKQLTYANKRGSPVAVICGDDEYKDKTVTLKNLLAIKGENNQKTVKYKDLIYEIKKII